MEFPEEKFKLAKDRYAKTRGGSSKFLYIACAECDEPAMIYQKDGPGRLLRYYADRIVWPPELVKAQIEVSVDSIKKFGGLACHNCQNSLGTPMVYESESRPAYRAVPGSVHAYRSPAQALARSELE
ncbi:MAG: hypothetical protein ABIP50_02335 [Candidatus Saccharimonadales bacterium]